MTRDRDLAGGASHGVSGLSTAAALAAFAALGLGLVALVLGDAARALAILAVALALVSLLLLALWRVRAPRLARAARLDDLTGLPDRFAFGENLAQAITRARARGEGLTAICVDFRRFRDVNEHLGHEGGDTILLAASKRIAALIPPHASLARIGGDQFAIVAKGCAQKDCERLANRFAEAMQAPFAVGDGRLALRIAVGAAFFDPADTDCADAQELLRRADFALAQSKATSAPYTAYTAELGAQMRAKKQLEDDLRHALAHDGLHVNYQPLYDIDGKTIVGAETLVRWIHPTLGFISPMTFVTLAEERGLVDQLGEFVLRRACHDARDWPAHLFVAVNVSPVQFRSRDFLTVVSRVLNESGLAPERLELELTETAIVSDEAAAEEMIIELRTLGVRMALDDFGVGYSSLVYLRRFAFDKIKIDRSFLEALEPSGESAILVESIVHLGRSLGLTVTAEGVETIEQHRFLQGVGCHELQGYLFSKPIPLEAFRKLALGGDEATNPGRQVA